MSPDIDFVVSALPSSINEVDKSISISQDVLSSLPQSSPLRAALLSSMGTLQLRRYALSDDEQDLEISILQFTHAIFLLFPLSIEGGPSIISTFFTLSNALCFRSRNSKQPSDIKHSIQYLHYLRDQSLEGPSINCNHIKSFLMTALALQLKLEPSNAMQGLEEMSVLCREFLASEEDPSSPVESFAQAVDAYLVDSWAHPSQQVIECLHVANMRLPDLHVVSLALSRAFFLCFNATRSNADYDNAMASLDKIISSHSPQADPSEYLKRAIDQAATFAFARFVFGGNPEYLEEAIFRLRARLSTISLEDPEHLDVVLRLEKLERTRFDELGITNGLPKLDSSGPEVVNPHSFSDLVGSLSKSNAVEPPLMMDADKLRHLDILSSMDQITDKVAIEEGVKYCRLLLASLKENPGGSMPATHLTTMGVGGSLLKAFEHTHNTEYLNESIDVFHGILKLPRAKWIHFAVIQMLIYSLFFRLGLSNDRKDLDVIMDLYCIAITETYANVLNRFVISCKWAQNALDFMHTSTYNAYESAISLMQDSLAFSPTLEIQHSRLITMRDSYEKLPLDYASYLIGIGQHTQAIETLERGRGLLWSEMRGLHAAIDQIHIVDPHLATRFAAINRDLEALTTSNSPNVWMNIDGEGDGGKEMDPFGRLVVEQRRLFDERKSLIMEIRSLPGLGNFLMAPSFDTLRCVAARGPVVIINHSEARSDIIILLHDHPPSLIPTPHNFYARAKGLRDQLLAARKKDLESREYEDALTFVLETLYDLIGRPVIQKLNDLNVPEQSRVWWCPTSVFCSLPLHAMGPICSDGRPKYFSDLYIPSYTPTLTALIESRKPGSHLSGKPSILLVAQPDESIPGSWEEISLIRRLKTKVTTLISKRATPSAVVNGLQDHRFAHFSCHGILDTGKPFDASFKLYGGKRLTLLEIIRSRLPSAEFAFLAACHTAELTEESIADEGLHLTAAVQYSGFRSVVGTMWEMADIDGHVLARNFYGSVFSDGWKDVPYYERTAEALRDAVKVLRRKRNMTTERWVNFVHYGA